MNADRLAINAGKEKGKTLVIVSLQQTQHDSLASLRFYGLMDAVFRKLSDCMMQDAIPRPRAKMASSPGARVVFQVSAGEYDPFTGDKLENSVPRPCFTLDLSEGRTIRVTRGPYLGETGTVQSIDAQGHFNIVLFLPKTQTSNTKVPVHVKLGYWWPLEAETGQAPYLPIVTCAPA
jgi:hypothetical protein